MRFEVSGQSGRADYVLFESHGPICVIEAKNPDKDPYEAKEQASVSLSRENVRVKRSGIMSVGPSGS